MRTDKRSQPQNYTVTITPETYAKVQEEVNTGVGMCRAIKNLLRDDILKGLMQPKDFTIIRNVNFLNEGYVEINAHLNSRLLEALSASDL